jgi:hypothetical protein
LEGCNLKVHVTVSTIVVLVFRAIYLGHEKMPWPVTDFVPEDSMSFKEACDISAGIALISNMARRIVVKTPA